MLRFIGNKFPQTLVENFQTRAALRTLYTDNFVILSVLHTISGSLFLLSLLAKIGLHYYIDKSMERGGGLSSFVVDPFMYFKFYKLQVTGKFAPAKRLCNLSLKLVYISLLANIVVGLLSIN
jgi:hypothetical protein